jgi:hypothetical protein
MLAGCTHTPWFARSPSRVLDCSHEPQVRPAVNSSPTGPNQLVVDEMTQHPFRMERFTADARNSVIDRPNSCANVSCEARVPAALGIGRVVGCSTVHPCRVCS